MAEPVVFFGICSTCIHARTCRGALNAFRPVQFCDLFEIIEEPVKREAPAPAERSANGGGNGEADDFKGLCIDCVKRFECSKAVSETGVWHCEEYQGTPA